MVLLQSFKVLKSNCIVAAILFLLDRGAEGLGSLIHFFGNLELLEKGIGLKFVVLIAVFFIFENPSAVRFNVAVKLLIVLLCVPVVVEPHANTETGQRTENNRNDIPHRFLPSGHQLDPEKSVRVLSKEFADIFSPVHLFLIGLFQTEHCGYNSATLSTRDIVKQLRHSHPFVGSGGNTPFWCGDFVGLLLHVVNH
jgi:hypothetical protein